MSTGLARSVQVRLVRHAKALGVDPNLILARYATERLLWAGFIRRNRLAAAPADLASVIDGIAGFAGPVLIAAGRGKAFSGNWPPGGPWQETAT